MLSHSAGQDGIYVIIQGTTKVGIRVVASVLESPHSRSIAGLARILRASPNKHCQFAMVDPAPVAGAPAKKTVKVRTTLPTLPFSSAETRPHITTARLLCRPLLESDAEAYHIMRSQPAVMARTSQGRVDRDLAETREVLSRFVPPRETDKFHFGVVWRETGELIGSGGVHKLAGAWGWPEIGYGFRHEFWGKGVGSEFVAAFLDAWRALPRSEVEIEVDARSVDDVPDGTVVAERMSAITERDNVASARLLQKNGFEVFTAYEEPDLRDPSLMFSLVGHRLILKKEQQ